MFDTKGRGCTRFAGVLLVLALVVIDQVAKQYFMELLVANGPRAIVVFPFFNLAPNWNYGVSFGMFDLGHDGRSWAVTVLTGALTLILIVWMWHTEDRATAICLGIIIGGACGNVIDRLRFGAVFDFLDVHAGGWHWPTFNFADVSIALGVAGMLLGTFGGDARATQPKP
jgi:signal peptidase II